MTGPPPVAVSETGPVQPLASTAPVASTSENPEASLRTVTTDGPAIGSVALPPSSLAVRPPGAPAAACVSFSCRRTRTCVTGLEPSVVPW